MRRTRSLIAARLANQRITGQRFAKPEEVVGWLGAVQAQEYAESKWALSMRMRRASHTAIERALTQGAILRTHVMRPTWHFVRREDIRWLLALTGDRVKARMAPYNRQLELDAAVFRKSEKALVRALRGQCLTRQELKVALERDGIRADGVQRLAHLVMQAELDAVICSGPRRGTQVTYALLDERAPASRSRSRDDALSELARRYFNSHGPAQLHDFAWWSGLTVADARAGIAMVDHEFIREIIDGKTYWFRSPLRTRSVPHMALLLSPYDEYLIAYKDRSAAFAPSGSARTVKGDPFSFPILLNGRVVGQWKRTVTRGVLIITLTPFSSLGRRDASAVAASARAYADFMESELELRWA